jgi:putative selenate reductase
LVQEFRRTFGARFPVSFSAGIDRANFPDAVALGLAPVTVCTDLLKPGGYGRAAKYFDALRERMDQVGARTVPELVLRAHGLGLEALSRIGADPASLAACQQAWTSGEDLAAAAGPELLPRWVAQTALLNTLVYVPRATGDARYARAHNAKPPRKVGSELGLFDCLTCGKCVPVCPNDANFAFVLPKLEQPIWKVRWDGAGWAHRQDGVLKIAQKQQYGCFTDFCNECGNCDVFCPEDGGPYAVKPRFFGRWEDFRAFASLDGFAVETADGVQRLWGRIGGREYALEPQPGAVQFHGQGFSLRLDPERPLQTLEGTAEAEVDLTPLFILRWLHAAVVSTGPANYINTLNEVSAR